jgi:hypothetical protein
MTDLKHKINHALDEGRILILGTQVLVGAQFELVFQSGFDKLPPTSRYLILATFAPLLIGLTLLLLITPYHHLVEGARVTARFHRFLNRTIGLALFPLAGALGLQLYVVTAKLTGTLGGVLVGGGAFLAALFAWYGLELIRRRQDRARSPRRNAAMAEHSQEPPAEEIQLDEKIRQVLTEARLVLPGAQALLAFGFAITLTDSFDRLPALSRYVHLLSLGLISLSVILLIAPAAYHRIVEDGEDTERLHRFASRAVLAALGPLGLALALDLYIVIQKVTDSGTGAVLGAGAMLLLFYGLWFGYTLYRRGRANAAS